MRGPGRVTDLSVVGLFVVVAVLVLTVLDAPRAAVWAVAIPLVLVAPGYTIVAALFPAGPSAGRSAGSPSRSPGWAARVGMVLVTSVLVVAVIGVLLSLGGVLRQVLVVRALAASVVVGLVIAWYRRRQIAPDQRSDPFLGVRSLPDRTGLSGFQTAALAVGMVALVAAVAVTGASPEPTESFSEASLLAGGETDELLGSNGTVTFVAGEPNAVHLRIQNHEGTETTYHIVGTLQRVGPNGTVLDSQRVDSGQRTVSAGTSAVLRRQVSPPTTGDRVRLQYLVYTGSVPNDPTVENASLTLRHWIEVEASQQ
ncbi:DUF1616 domain-containing protein [Haloarcula sp. GH36]|uniref:DUF1616 domain-containing protein n=1 Tax=Haloarcula montana TaxID=3111776 RepID=UPI002D76CBB5|nr:DUF1616 domain-containing protein [Haloarcula sp. GH36]